MRQTVRPFAAATAACLCLGAASGGAAEGEGFYVGVGAGVSSMRDGDVEGHANALYSPPLDATSSLDRGLAVNGAVGYRLAGGLRVEGELGYRKNDLDALDVREPGGLAALLPPGAPPAALKGKRPIEGDLQALSFMANLWYDIDLEYDMKPYVGAGVGMTRLSLTAKSSGVTVADDTDTAFAWQIGAGVGYEIGETGDGRPVVLGLDYRFHGGADPTFTGSLTGTPFDAEVGGSYAGVGLRFGL